MAVSKRTRYEVLRRDGFTCRYCRSSGNELTVDHVTPVALGGTDDPGNLVAACRDCNAGKSSASPEAETVAVVSEDAIRWASGIRAALATAVDDIAAARAYRGIFLDAWQEWIAWRGEPHPMPDSFIGTLETWRKIGVPPVMVEEAVLIAMSNSNIRSGDKFRYFCGVVWRKLDEIKPQIEAAFPPSERTCGHCYGCRSDDGDCRAYAELEEDEEPTLCAKCGRRDCLYGLGYDEGGLVGWEAARDQFGGASR